MLKNIGAMMKMYKIRSDKFVVRSYEEVVMPMETYGTNI